MKRSSAMTARILLFASAIGSAAPGARRALSCDRQSHQLPAGRCRRDVHRPIACHRHPPDRIFERAYVLTCRDAAAPSAACWQFGAGVDPALEQSVIKTAL